MTPKAFIGRKAKPTTARLIAALGERRELRDQLRESLAKQSKIVDQEWNSYSPKAGWALGRKREEGNLLYLSPSHGCFQAACVQGAHRH